MRTTFLFAFLLLTTAAQAEERIAVLELSGNLEPSVLRVLADEVRAGALSATRGTGVKVLTRENLASLADDMDLDLACVEGEASCEVDFGRALGVSMVVTGTALKLDDALIVTLRMHSSADGALLSTASVNKSTIAKTLEWLPRRAKQLVLNGLGVSKDAVLLDGAVLHPQPGGLPPALLPVTKELPGRPCKEQEQEAATWIAAPMSLLEGAEGQVVIGEMPMVGLSPSVAYLAAASKARGAIVVASPDGSGTPVNAVVAAQVLRVHVACDFSRVVVALVHLANPRPDPDVTGWLRRTALLMDGPLSDWPHRTPAADGMVLGIGVGTTAATADATALAELAFSTHQSQLCESISGVVTNLYLGGKSGVNSSKCVHFALAPMACPDLPGGVVQRWKDPETRLHYALAASPRPEVEALQACAAEADASRADRAARLTQVLDQARSTSSRPRADASAQLAAERALQIGNEVGLVRSARTTVESPKPDETVEVVTLVMHPGGTSWLTERRTIGDDPPKVTEDVQSIRHALLSGRLPRADDVKKILARMKSQAKTP